MKKKKHSIPSRFEGSLCTFNASVFHFLKPLCADLTWPTRCAKNRKTISSDWLGARAMHTSYLNHAIISSVQRFICLQISLHVSTRQT